jgi:hypothetical protein
MNENEASSFVYGLLEGFFSPVIELATGKIHGR